MKKITINNIEKTAEEWLIEFEEIGRPDFYKKYGVLNKRILMDLINESTFANKTDIIK